MSKFIAAPFGNYIKTEKTISVTGSWTIEKRTGRLIQIAKTLRLTKRGWVNKIGLRNPGVVNGLKKYKENDSLLILESLPARETRNYIKLVLTNLWIYKIRFKQDNSILSVLASGKPINFKVFFNSNTGS